MLSFYQVIKQAGYTSALLWVGLSSFSLAQTQVGPIPKKKSSVNFRNTTPDQPSTESKAPPQKGSKRAIFDRLEASVNSSIILLSDVQKFREIVRLRSQLDPLFAGTPVASKGAQASNAEIVEFLINERLITQQYPKTDTEVEQEINSIQTNNRLTRNSLKEALTHEGYKFADYFELIRDSSSKRDLIDRDIRTKVSISEDDIKNYFYNNMSRTENSPRAYHIKIISVSLSSYKTPSAAQKVATDALKSIQSGEEFEEVARRVSDDHTAETGGDLGTLTEDQMSPQIRDQIKKLQIGKVSEVLGGPAGAPAKPAKNTKGSKTTKAEGRYYILKLADIKSVESERYEKVKEEIRSQLASAEYQHQISLWLERQRQAAFIHKAGDPSTKGLPVTR
jgi:peptidyl-prolyl cis-trans isomerase SurA